MLGVLRRNPLFRKLWFSQTISQVGDSLNRIAFLTVVGRVGGGEGWSIAGVGLLYGVELALRLVPYGLLGSLAGPAADRLPRKLVMIAADLLRAVLVLGYCLVDEPGELRLLYGLLFAQISVSAFAEAARSAALPSTVARADLYAAYALHGVTWSSAFVVGSLLGGLCVDLIGTSAVFVMDGATFLVSASLLAGLSLPPAPVHALPFRWPEVLRFTELRRGLAHARERRLGLVLAAKTFWCGVGGALTMLAVAGDLQRFGTAHTPSSTTSALFAARFLGTALGPVVARRLGGSSDRALTRQIAAAFAVAVVGYGLFPLAPTLFLGGACIVVAHMGGSTLWVSSTTAWQRHVDDAFRGRVFALEFLGTTTMTAATAVAAGLLFDATGSFAGTTWAVCALILAAGAAWFALLLRSERAPAAVTSAAGGSVTPQPAARQE